MLHHTVSHQLTKEEVQALRKATDSVCFDYNPDQGLSRIRANSKVGTGEGSTRTVYIEVDSFIRYQAKAFEGQPVYRCYEMIHFPQMAEWQTIAGSLRAGDVIKLDWRESGNGYLEGSRCNLNSKDGYVVARDEPIYWDRLFLRVQRPLKRSTKELVCQDDQEVPVWIR
jgi:hypothetical protein